MNFYLKCIRGNDNLLFIDKYYEIFDITKPTSISSIDVSDLVFDGYYSFLILSENGYLEWFNSNNFDLNTYIRMRNLNQILE